MKAVVFLGSYKSGSSYDAIRAAEDMRYYTILLTFKLSHIDKRLEFPHAHSVRLCNLDDTGAVRRSIQRLVDEGFSLQAVVSFIDPYCHTAAVLSREFGLPAFTEGAIAAMLDKVKTRDALAGTAYSPYYRVAHDPLLTSKAAGLLPAVLKSPVSTGSKDVHLARTPREYADAFRQLQMRYPGEPMLVEGFIDGPQYLVETLTLGGEVTIAAAIEQEITFAGRFIVTGYQVLMENHPKYAPLRAAAEQILRAMGMEDGPCHLELRLDTGTGRWRLIEINPRISGGAMNQLIETALGVNLAKETLKAALGLMPDLTPKARNETYLQYVVVPKGGTLQKVTGKALAQSSAGVRHVYVKPRKGAVLLPPISMGCRYAYVIASGRTAGEAKANAKAAAAKIVFHLSGGTGNTPLGDAEQAALSDIGRSQSAARSLRPFAGHVMIE